MMTNNAALKKQVRDDQPQPTATPLDGEPTVDANVVIEAQLVTFKAMSSIVKRIADEIRAEHADTQAILIYNADDVAALRHYRTSYPLFTAKIGALQKQYDDLLAAYRAEHTEMHALNPLVVISTRYVRSNQQ